MSLAIALMQAVLGPGTTELAARRALEQALLCESEPLHWCATRLGVSDAEVMRRAAAWANMPFFDVVPRVAQAELEPHRLEMLGETRLYRMRLFDRDIAFAAPDFFGILRLAERERAFPGHRLDLYLVPETALRSTLVEHAGPALVDGARQTLARLWPLAAAQLELTRPVRRGFVLLVIGVVLLILAAPVLGQAWLAPLWIGLVLLPTVLRLAALLEPYAQEDQDVAEIEEDALPRYSVLVPLRDEANMVDQLYATLGQIDYPADRLDIHFVVESSSPATIAAVRQHLDDARFSLLVVPDALPRTKPKALGFALPLCRGEFLVVYDAEDRPEPDQLRKVVAQFRRQPAIECIQARLVIDNGRDGPIPALFAGEYAGLFAVLLPALARWGAVMPLGGTSNHFRVATLRHLGGWDAFNVTEDADLAVRLARRKLRCATTTARTFEAAPTRLAPWLGQRTRWMKGWMQTYVVHNRHPGNLLADLGWRGIALFQVILLGMLLAPLLHAGFVLVILGQLAMGRAMWLEPEIWPLACMAVLILGQVTALAINLLGLKRTGQADLGWWQFLIPFYWMLIGYATLRALREFAVRPFDWFKTPHLATGKQAESVDAGEQQTYVEGKSIQRFGRKPIRVRSPAG